MPRCFMAKKLKYPYQQWKETRQESENSGDCESVKTSPGSYRSFHDNTRHFLGPFLHSYLVQLCSALLFSPKGACQNREKNYPQKLSFYLKLIFAYLHFLRVGGLRKKKCYCHLPYPVEPVQCRGGTKDNNNRYSRSLGSNCVFCMYPRV